MKADFPGSGARLHLSMHRSQRKRTMATCPAAESAERAASFWFQEKFGLETKRADRFAHPGLLVRMTLKDREVTADERYLASLKERIRDMQQGRTG
jgi:hypothetical protein